MTFDLQRSRIAACALLAWGGALTSVPTVAFAQPTQLVEVTGSRILRPELNGNTPAIAVSPEMLGNLGFENFADMATQLPQFAAAFGASRTQSTVSGPQNTGLNLVNLRNLGFGRSLVLINGRRTVGGTSTTTAPDFNTVPTANIERIDIITGGASAVYGSDAVAGVINIITKKNFDGFEVGAGYGQTQRGDNRNPTGHVMWGRSFGESGRVLATLQLDRQGQVSCRDRELCSDAFLWTSPATPLRGPPAYSTVGVGGRFFVGSNSYTRRNNSFVDANGQLIPFVLGIDGFNGSFERDLAIPTRRTMGSLDGEFRIAPSVRAYGELNYGKTEVTSHFESFGFQSQQPGSLFGTLQATIPIDNPFIPAPLLAAINALNAAAPAAQRIDALTWAQRFLTVNGLRGATNDRETTRVALGIKGDAKFFGNDWRWDVYHVEGRTETTLRANGLVSTSNLYHGLRVEPDPAAAGRFRCADSAARAAGCVPINPFAAFTAEMQNALRVDAISTGTGTLGNSVATLSGTLAELPAGSLRAAAGLERRRISGFLDVAAVTNDALATGTPIPDTDKSTFTTREAFVEALIPVLADRPGVRSLNLEAAFRRSEADRSGYDTWKIGGDWEPAPGLRLRAMRARAVRAPEPRDYTGGLITPATIIDPCTAARRNASPTRAANCAADGVPANYTPAAVIEASVTGRIFANPDLAPEVGTTLTLGLVWEPAYVPGLSVAIDRFKIGIQGSISALSRQIAVDKCYDTAERQLCERVLRGTHPVLPGATYVLRQVHLRIENISAQDIAGADVDIRYRWKTGYGQFEAGVLFTYYDKAILIASEDSAPVDLLGKAAGSPNGWIRKTATANLGWRMGPFRANWNVRYIGDADMAVGTTAQGYPRIPEMVYHNLRAGYAFAKGSEAFFGISNVGDRKPPQFASGTLVNQPGDTIPGYYDVFGRSFFVGARMTFR